MLSAELTRPHPTVDAQDYAPVIEQPMPNDVAIADTDPIVVVGNGPVGMRFVEELLSRSLEHRIVAYGEEGHHPYDRVQLSSWLAGDVALDSLMHPVGPGTKRLIDERLGTRIAAIDLVNKFVTDQFGQTQAYSLLVLATGSRPFVPNVPGLDLSGVYTLRNLDDANALMARRARSHRTIVIGGGLLGIESAKGMLSAGTTVTVVEHSDRLLASQLDFESGERLKSQLTEAGLRFQLSDGVKEIGGNGRVEWALLQSGQRVECDTVIVATGIRPNIDLAQQAGLAFGRGIRVDNEMRTSDPSVLAIGECAEHKNKVYGLVAPGFEQAAVAASTVTRGPARYDGSVAASRLKVVGTPVFSMGPFGIDAAPFFGVTYVYRNASDGIYRKILVRGLRLHGALGIGDWPETVRLQTFIGGNERIYPWNVFRFVHTGRLWPADEGASVRHWPASATVCQCNGVSRGVLTQAIETGSATVQAIASRTKATTVCGSCKPLVSQLLDFPQPQEPVSLSRSSAIVSVIALTAALTFLLYSGFGYAESSRDQGWFGLIPGVHWDVLWRDSFIKQVTGFTILGLFAIGLLVSARKRVKRLHKFGGFDYWRFSHVILGLLCVGSLVAHTGFRMGSGLDFILMSVFVAMLLIGSAASLLIAFSHRFDAGVVTRLRRQSVFTHLLLFWPVPALLFWHVFKTYWY